MALKQITIIGTGLIGGSFGMAVEAAGLGCRIVGCDRPAVLQRAIGLGAIHAGVEDPVAAIQGSDLIFLATPVGSVIDLIERLGPVASPEALITDTGSTKREIVDRARAVFGGQAARRFLGGHPMAGKEHGGIESAEPGLFRNAVWLLVSPAQEKPVQEKLAQENFENEKITAYRQLLEKTGARIMTMDAERHDRLCAWISHLPQMISTALAATLVDEFAGDPDLHAVGGRALREMTRVASSSYSMWRDIAYTNSGNIERALHQVEQRLAHLRENLRSQALKEEFERGNQFELKKTT